MAEPTDQVIHFSEYFKVIRNRLWVIFTILVLSIFSGAYVTEEIMPKVYTATSNIQINRRGELDITGATGMSAERMFDPVDFQSEFEIMQAKDVLLPIIHDLKLDEAWAKRMHLDRLPEQDALDYMTKGVLKFDSKKNTNIVVVTATTQDPKEAAAIANAIADRYKAMRDSKQDQKNGHGLDSLRDQIATQQKVVDDQQAEVDKILAAAAKEHVQFPLKGSDYSGDKAEQELTDRKKDFLVAQEDYDQRRVLLTKLQNLSDDEFVNTLSAMGHQETNIATLRAELFKLQSDIENLLKDGFETSHPRILAMKAEVESHRTQITELVAGVRRALVLDCDVAQSKVALLQKAVDDLTAKVEANKTAYMQPYNEATRKLGEQQSILAAFQIRLQQDMADLKLMQSPVTIISRAEPPDKPSGPNKSLWMLVSALIGLLVGVGVAFVIEFLDTSVKTMADAESLLGLPVLTVIPNKGGPMPLTQEAARLPHAEGYRILRAKLDLKVMNGVGPSVSMLSGGPGEGKSTTIYNLAVVSAQAGQSVILVDCDLRRPTIHGLVNLPNDRGLANYLRGEGDAVEYIQQTAIPKLHVLSSGDMPMAEIGVLAGDKIRAMLEDLKQRYDLVLVDSPPILGISDGSIIAREVDYVILVIQHRRYPREISLRAKRAIEEVHGNCVGMVLNCVSVKSDDSYYYYSNYGNYYKKTDRKKKQKDASKAKSNGKAVAAANGRKELNSEEF